MAMGESSNGLANPILLEKIDHLFEANIGEYIDLPQLLVVGDQSSGKSSVLEGLTGLPFPRDKGLCTRFATQITFRRVPIQRISVSIVPHVNSNEERKKKLRAWRKEDLTELTKEDFSKIMTEVHIAMDIADPKVAQADGKGTFAEDVLKIEICGPGESHFSIIDVPGIFRMKTEGVTTDQDKELVKNMVRSYMHNPRSVILAIVPANSDIATQDIVEMAAEYDKSGERTLGVLTKPDIVDEGAEHAVLEVILGKSHRLKLGWCIVRNLKQKELDSSESNRHEIEKNFFKTVNPWTAVPKNQAGIEALRTCLVGMLADMIEREFPKVKAEISQRLKASRQHLNALGPSREGRREQHNLLLDLAERFQKLADHALDAKYGRDDLFNETKDIRLATLVTDRDEKFSHDVWKFGHTIAFGTDASDSDGEDVTPPSREAEDEHFPVRYSKGSFELEDVLPDVEQIKAPQQSGIKGWLEETYRRSRGSEVGTFDASLFPLIFKEQSVNWGALTLGYISDIVCIVHEFIVSLLSSICVDARLQKGIKQVMLDQLLAGYKKAIDQADFLLEVERKGQPRTLNHYFADNLEKARESRLKKLTKSKVFRLNNNTDAIRITDLNVRSNLSNLEHIVEDLHDILEAYYKVARKRFVDVVCRQAADHYLVYGPETPVKLFSAHFVNNLTDDQLERIAGEDASTKQKRQELKHDIEILEKGRKILM